MTSTSERPFERPEDEPYADAPEPPITVAVLAGGAGQLRPARSVAGLSAEPAGPAPDCALQYPQAEPARHARTDADASNLSEGVAADSHDSGDSIQPQQAAAPDCQADAADAAEQTSSQMTQRRVSDGLGGRRTVESLPQHLRTGGIHVLTYWLDADMTAHAC